MTDRQAAELSAMLMAGWPAARCSKATLALYGAKLRGYEYQAGRKAVDGLHGTSDFLPSIKQLQDALDAVSGTARGIADEQWTAVGQAIRAVGTYGAPRFRDPVTEHCVCSIGWRRLCKGDNDAADRAAFVRLYNQVAERDTLQKRAGTERSIAAPGRIAGFIGAVGNGGRS